MALAAAVDCDGRDVRRSSQPKECAIPPKPTLGDGSRNAGCQSSGVQDLWFARFYLLKPLMISGLALFWMLSGVIPMLSPIAASRHFRPLCLMAWQRI